MKFHKREIKKGIYGELSKIQEELDEAFDAEEQKQDLMLLIELSDIIGACAGVAKKYGMTLEQLVAFAKLRSEAALGFDTEIKIAKEDVVSTVRNFIDKLENESELSLEMTIGFYSDGNMVSVKGVVGRKVTIMTATGNPVTFEALEDDNKIHIGVVRTTTDLKNLLWWANGGQWTM